MFRHTSVAHECSSSLSRSTVLSDTFVLSIFAVFLDQHFCFHISILSEEGLSEDEEKVFSSVLRASRCFSCKGRPISVVRQTHTANGAESGRIALDIFANVQLDVHAPSQPPSRTNRQLSKMLFFRARLFVEMVVGVKKG